MYPLSVQIELDLAPQGVDLDRLRRLLHRIAKKLCPLLDLLPRVLASGPFCDIWKTELGH